MQHSTTYFLTLVPYHAAQDNALYDLNEKFQLWQLANSVTPLIEDQMQPFRNGRSAASVWALWHFIERVLRPAAAAERKLRAAMNPYARSGDDTWTPTRRSLTNMRAFVQRHLTPMQLASLEHIITCRTNSTPTIAMTTLLGISGDLVHMVEHYIKLEIERKELVSAGVQVPERDDLPYKHCDYKVRYLYNGATGTYYAHGIDNLRGCDIAPATALAKLVVCLADRKKIKNKHGTASRVGNLININLTLK